ncbi:twin-arginine translocase TatA/TatE family subunit [Paramicrobacterium fandaimingii]|uniref:twin-arginine translocase TatA/TatE family subunit n=1 Tax=Paramicrobacterium fandaimingii TaxID=2708079 RepID=UPI003D9C7A02
MTGWHLLIILFLVLLLFGAPKLPGLARSVGQSMKIFKSEIKNDDDTSKTNDERPNTDKTTPTSPDSTAPEKSSDDPTPKP